MNVSVDVYMSEYVNRQRKVTCVSKKAKNYIHKYVNKHMDRVILSKPEAKTFKTYKPEGQVLVSFGTIS